MEDNEKREYSLIDEYLKELYGEHSFTEPKIKDKRKKDTYTLKRKIKAKTIIITFLVGIIAFMLLVFPLYVSQYSNILKISDIVVHDMVHLFEKGNYTFTLDNLGFEKPYKYFIKITIVTPHTSKIGLTLFDPGGKLFRLFDHTLDAYS